MVMRVGSGGTLAAAAAPIRLLSFDPYLGSLTATVALPSATSPGACTVSGSSAFDSGISLTLNGTFVVVPCADVVAGGTVAATSNKVLARVDYRGVVDTSFVVSGTAVSATDFTSAASVTGNEAYMGTSSGIFWVSSSGATPVQLATYSIRDLSIDRTGQLWGASTAGATQPLPGVLFPKTAGAASFAPLLTATSVGEVVVQNSTTIWFSDTVSGVVVLYACLLRV